MDTKSEIESLKAFIAETERRTAQINAYADRLALEYERKEKEAARLRKQIADLEAELESKYKIRL